MYFYSSKKKSLHLIDASAEGGVDQQLAGWTACCPACIGVNLRAIKIEGGGVISLHTHEVEEGT